MNDVEELFRLALLETLDLLPWFMLAVLLGVFVRLLSLDVIARRLFKEHGIIAIVSIAAVGAFSPFCSFTVIPLIRKFLKAGVPLSAVMAFWIASPAMSPEMFALSAARLGVPMALTRLVGALVLSVGAGLVVLMLEARGYLGRPLREDRTGAAEAPSGCSASAASEPARALAEPAWAVAAAGAAGPAATIVLERPSHPAGTPAPVAADCGTDGASAASSCGGTALETEEERQPWWPQVRADLGQLDVHALAREVVSDTWSLGRWLLVAVVFEALIIRYVPRQAVADTLGSSGILSVPLAAVLSIPLYLNGVSAIPIVGGLVAKGMAPGAGITFLLAGSVTTIPAMAAVRYVVRSNVFLLYAGVSVVGSILIGAVANLWL